MKNLYQRLKQFGKEAIMVGGLILALNGCGRKVEYKTTQIFKDLNKDGKPEQVYLVRGEDHFTYTDYDLIVRENKGIGFEESRLLHRFVDKPEEIKIEDINGDGNQDLVYLVRGKDHFTYTDYDLIVKYGNGDGTFKEPSLVQRFKNKPAGLN